MFVYVLRAKHICALLLLVCAVVLSTGVILNGRAAEENSDYIKYAEFNVPYAALQKAMEDDIACKGVVSWIDVLAFLSAKYGGEWSRYKSADMDAIHERLHNGEDVKEITKDMEYFAYFRQVYEAVLGDFLGYYARRTPGSEDEPAIWNVQYGLRAFSPLAEGYYYNDFDDFGAKRSYGFKRTHMGHDMMGSVGTPVAAVESGTVEVMGWNQYGGWRVGIRSHDGKRYWYYAHLRKDHPFHTALSEGDTVTAGQIIGYLGQTGYSAKENVNGIETPHLHYGLELVFDEKQKESSNEIWVDLYAITRLLSQNRVTVHQEEDGEFYRTYDLFWIGDYT